MAIIGFALLTFGSRGALTAMRNLPHRLRYGKI